MTKEYYKRIAKEYAMKIRKCSVAYIEAVLWSHYSYGLNIHECNAIAIEVNNYGK